MRSRPLLWRLIVRRLRRHVPGPAHNALLGDLVEDYRADRRTRGWLRAEWRTWHDAGSIARSYHVEHRGRRFVFGGTQPPFRQTLRGLRRTPWYAATVIAVMALTTALSATVFAIVDGVLFKPLPYQDADQLRTASGRRANGRGGALSLDEIRTWQRDLPDVPISAFQSSSDAGTLGDGVIYGAASVEQQFFNVLGQHPLLGGFRPEHFVPGAPEVAIISHRLWRGKMGGTMDVLGRVLPLAGATDNYGRPLAKPTIVGVLPADFVHPSGELADILRPFAPSPEDSRNRSVSNATGLLRLPPGVNADALANRLSESTRGAQRDDQPERLRYVGASLRTLDDLGITWRRSFRQLAGVSATLILLACVAIATLASGRARQQSRQALVRRALGATSWDLFLAAFREGVVLVSAGSAAGLISAPVILAMVLALKPVQDSLVKAPAIDGRVFMLVAAVGLIAALITALASVASSNRITLASSSAEGATKGVRHFERLLISTQAALAFVLTLGGSLGMASLWQAWKVDPGFDPSGLVVVDVNVRTVDIRQVAAKLSGLNDALGALPGVTAGMFSGRFLGGGWSVATARSHANAPEIELQSIQASRTFFDVLKLTPVEGRLPTPDEFSRGDDVVVLSDRAARALWPEGPAIGRRVLFPQRSATVIGLIPEPQFGGLLNGPMEAGQIYFTRGGRRETSFVMRTTGSTDAALEGARRIVASVGTDVDLIRAITVHDALADTIKTRRLAAWLHGGFAVSALVIVATAVLGLVAMATSMRAREFGIRQALGARRDGLVAMLLREQVTTVAIGLCAGAIVAYWFQELLRGAAAGVAPTDYRLWIATAATILITATLGVLIPAVRSVKVDPALTLRAE